METDEPHSGRALITGASSGIGKAVAEALLEAGLTVYGTSRQPGAAERDPRIRWLTFDGEQESGVEALERVAENLLSNLYILINNSGSSRFGDLTSLNPDAPERQINLLLRAPVELCRKVLPGMRERGRGVIVNVSSLAAEFPLPYMALYTAGKSGLSGFTRSLILTERTSGVVVIDFRPGDYHTGFRRAMGDGAALTAGERVILERMERRMREGPAAAHAAKALMRAIRRGRSGTVVCGGFFQARVAQLGWRLLPRGLFLKVIRRYYGLAGG